MKITTLLFEDLQLRKIFKNIREHLTEGENWSELPREIVDSDRVLVNPSYRKKIKTEIFALKQILQSSSKLVNFSNRRRKCYGTN